MNMELLYEYGSRAGFWCFTGRSRHACCRPPSMQWRWRSDEIARRRGRWLPPVGRWRRTAIAGSITSKLPRQSSASTSPEPSKSIPGRWAAGRSVGTRGAAAPTPDGSVLYLSEGQFRRIVCESEDRPAYDVDRSALPDRRTAGANRRPRALSRLHQRARTGLDRYRQALDRDASVCRRHLIADGNLHPAARARAVAVGSTSNASSRITPKCRAASSAVSRPSSTSCRTASGARSAGRP